MARKRKGRTASSARGQPVAGLMVASERNVNDQLAANHSKDHPAQVVAKDQVETSDLKNSTENPAPQGEIHLTEKSVRREEVRRMAKNESEKTHAVLQAKDRTVVSRDPPEEAHHHLVKNAKEETRVAPQVKDHMVANQVPPEEALHHMVKSAREEIHAARPRKDLTVTSQAQAATKAGSKNLTVTKVAHHHVARQENRLESRIKIPVRKKMAKALRSAVRGQESHLTRLRDLAYVTPVARARVRNAEDFSASKNAKTNTKAPGQNERTKQLRFRLRK
jgi:hypothetical protein